MKISSSKYLHVSEASSSSPSVMGTWVGLSSMPSYSITFSCAWPDLVRLRLWGDNGLSRGFYRWLLCRGGHGLSVCSGLWRDGRLGSESGVGLATSLHRSDGESQSTIHQHHSTKCGKALYPCVPFGRAHPNALIPSKGLPSGVRALKG